MHHADALRALERLFGEHCVVKLYAPGPQPRLRVERNDGCGWEERLPTAPTGDAILFAGARAFVGLENMPREIRSEPCKASHTPSTTSVD